MKRKAKRVRLTPSQRVEAMQAAGWVPIAGLFTLERIALIAACKAPCRRIGTTFWVPRWVVAIVKRCVTPGAEPVGLPTREAMLRRAVKSVAYRKMVMATTELASAQDRGGL